MNGRGNGQLNGRGRSTFRGGRSTFRGERPRRENINPPSRYRDVPFSSVSASRIGGGRASDRGRISNSSARSGGRVSSNNRDRNGGLGHGRLSQQHREPRMAGGTASTDETTVKIDDNNSTNEDSSSNQDEKEKPPTPWGKSSAKKKLYNLFMDDSSWVHICTFEQIYDSDFDFQKYKRDRFISNARNLLGRVGKVKDALEFDRKALTEDMKLYPKKSITERGYVRYEGSEIERLLKKDVKDGKSKGVKPAVLWASRVEYTKMPLHIFRSHKNREDQYVVESVGWQKKRNDKERLKAVKQEDQNDDSTTYPTGQQI